MRLGALRRHWDRLGRADPFWAVLTDPAKRRGGWDPEEFFRDGVEEIETALRRAGQFGFPLRRRRALDFGCGVGRITQALARSFDRCDGVDISESMLRGAARYNRFPGRCVYHLNHAPDLALFDTSSFDFVYSTLVLQHMPPEYGKGYLRELLRVLEPGGLLVVQLPSHRADEEPTAGAARTSIAGKLPVAACRARLSIESLPALRASLEQPLVVTVENRSAVVWPCLADNRGRLQLNVANHWLFPDGEVMTRDDARCPLPHDLEPGQRVRVVLGIRAPQFDGHYDLELDLVQENVGWFGQRGSDTLRIRCHVTGGLPAPPRKPAAQVPDAPFAEPPFRERHPKAYSLLRATGIRDAYWAWRGAIDGTKRRRDRLILAFRARVVEPVVPPLVNWWRGKPFAPRMEMYCTPRHEVLELLARHGGRTVHVDEERMPGGFHSCRYWATKDR
jgi:SAM-dependent methyltransferase